MQGLEITRYMNKKDAKVISLAFVTVFFCLVIAFEITCLAQTSAQTRSALPVKSNPLLEEGIAAFERGEDAAAQKAFEQVLVTNRTDVMANTYLGIIADRAGDLAKAEHYFATAASADPGSASAHNNYGAVLLKLGRPREAALQFEASIRLNKDQPNALVNLAQLRFGSGKAEDLRLAQDYFARAYALAPDAEISRALVVIALRLKDQAAATRYFSEYSSRLSNANGQTSSAAARAELGSALLESGLAKEAVVELSAAESAEPTNAETVVRLAKAYIALNDLPSAGRTLEAAVARKLETAPIYALLASVYEKSGHIENAIPAMRLAIQADPQSETYRFTYGMLLTSVLAPEAAVIRLNEALQQFPNSARLWLALGIAHFKAGRNEEAAKTLTHAIELDSKFAPAFAYLGMTYVEVGRYDDGIKSYEKALVANEKLGVVDYLIADALQRQATAEASRIELYLVRAVKLEPSFALARLALGKLYFRTERLPEALAEFEQVVKLDPNLPETYYQLGRLYTRLKRPAEAQTTLAKFKQISESQKEQQQKDRKDIVRRLADVRF